MPAAPPVIQIAGISAAPAGWYVDFGSGDTRDVVCWGLLFDNSGGVPMVFDSASGKLIAASAVKSSYRLIHSVGAAVPDSIATLLDNIGQPGQGQIFSLGGFYSRKTLYATAQPGTTFAARIEGSADGDTWVKFGDFSAPGIKTYVELTIHYVRATLDSVSNGAVTIRMAWS